MWEEPMLIHGWLPFFKSNEPLVGEAGASVDQNSSDQSALQLDISITPVRFQRASTRAHCLLSKSGVSRPLRSAWKGYLRHLSRVWTPSSDRTALPGCQLEAPSLALVRMLNSAASKMTILACAASRDPPCVLVMSDVHDPAFKNLAVPYGDTTRTFTETSVVHASALHHTSIGLVDARCIGRVAGIAGAGRAVGCCFILSSHAIPPVDFIVERCTDMMRSEYHSDARAPPCLHPRLCLRRLAFERCPFSNGFMSDIDRDQDRWSCRGDGSVCSWGSVLA
ncbi:hypothetical protein C8Q76DRAFT_758846 [Earliella scabrosa]|nr:hypothetical protein C8Q76DRAFT_758846 [Earliella scabrosa]